MELERRLSDRILNALDLAIEQGSYEIASHLHLALELTLTRKTGGLDFVERRDLSPNMLQTLDRFKLLKEQAEKGSPTAVSA